MLGCGDPEMSVFPSLVMSVLLQGDAPTGKERERLRWGRCVGAPPHFRVR